MMVEKQNQYLHKFYVALPKASTSAPRYSHWTEGDAI